MAEQAKVRTLQPAPDANCPHYWLIDSPAGETSEGRCKHCGATRTFYNSTQRTNTLRAARAPATQQAP